MNKIAAAFNSTRSISLMGLLCWIFIGQACTKKYEEINTPRNTIATIGQSQLPFLFAQAQAIAIPWSGNYQGAQNQYADQYAQYFAVTATYFPSDRLVIVPYDLNTLFDPMYSVFVPQLQTIFAATDASSAEYALANIIWAVGFHRLTDYFGPVPYFQAGLPAKSVPYDGQDKIYDDLFKRLSSAVEVLKNKQGEVPYGNFDAVYGGNVPMWIKFANSLRLRLALRISNVDPARAKTEAEAAVAAGVLSESPDDDAYIHRSGTGSDVNGLSLMSDWNEFRMSASMESVLKGYDDPRMPVYFLPAEKTGTYEGMRNGLTPAQLTDDLNKNEANSHVGARWSSTSFGGVTSYLSTPQILMCTAESYFLRAEGALLNWNMGGTAKELYEQGITNSMIQYGISEQSAITNYINNTNLPIAPQDYLNSPPVTDVPVKFDAGNVEVQLKQIILQKWLALFPDGAEAWADYRRSRAVVFYPVANSENPDLVNPNVEWIRRATYLVSERLNNTAAVEEAEQLLGGPDKITTPLWWDRH